VDLIVLAYQPLRHILDRIYRGLKPRSIVVIENFHRDTKRYRLLRAGGFFRDNELLKLFANYRILHYEDVSGKADWGSNSRSTALCVSSRRSPLRQYPAAIGKARST